MDGKKAILGVGMAALAAGAAYFAFFARWAEPRRPSNGDGDARAEQVSHAAAPIAAARSATAQAQRKPAKGKSKRRVRAADAGVAELPDQEEYAEYSPEDRKRMLAIEAAAENEDFAALAALALDVQNSTNSEVRSELVDNLGTYGKKALLELMPFMADPDPDIAENARDQWTMALSEIDSEKSKCKYIESAMGILTDEDTLSSMMTELAGCDDRLAIQTIVNVIASGTKQAVSAAKEQYEFITGEEYSDFAAAENWLQENYEPDEN